MEYMTNEELDMHECSDRFWLPQHLFAMYTQSNEPGIVSFLKLTNGVEQSVVGIPFGVHTSSPDVVYIPQWMYARMEFDTDNIDIERYIPSLCSGLVVQPFTSDHLQTDDPQQVLSEGFELYSSIQSGTILPLMIHGKQVEVQIVDTIPNTNEPLCIRNCELTLDLLQPPGEHEPEEELPPVEEAPAPAPTPSPPANIREILANAARMRLAQSEL